MPHRTMRGLETNNSSNCAARNWVELKSPNSGVQALPLGILTLALNSKPSHPRFTAGVKPEKLSVVLVSVMFRAAIAAGLIGVAVTVRVQPGAGDVN